MNDGREYFDSFFDLGLRKVFFSRDVKREEELIWIGKGGWREDRMVKGESVE